MVDGLATIGGILVTLVAAGGIILLAWAVGHWLGWDREDRGG